MFLPVYRYYIYLSARFLADYAYYAPRAYIKGQKYFLIHVRLPVRAAESNSPRKSDNPFTER
jgi:hypothetical protein